MKLIPLLFFLSVLLTLAETVPVPVAVGKLVSGEHNYTDVKVSAWNPAEIRFTHSGGISKLSWSNVPADIKQLLARAGIVETVRVAVAPSGEKPLGLPRELARTRAEAKGYKTTEKELDGMQWLEGKRGNNVEFTLSCFPKRITVTASLTKGFPSNTFLPDSAGDVAALLGKDRARFEAWARALLEVSPAKEVTRYQAELDGVRLFAAVNNGHMMMIEASTPDGAMPEALPGKIEVAEQAKPPPDVPKPMSPAKAGVAKIEFKVTAVKPTASGKYAYWIIARNTGNAAFSGKFEGSFLTHDGTLVDGKTEPMGIPAGGRTEPFAIERFTGPTGVHYTAGISEFLWRLTDDNGQTIEGKARVPADIMR